MESVLLIRFSIEKLNELPGPYSFQKGFLVGQAVPARLLTGMVIWEGDTPDTLRGLEYVTVVAVMGDRETLLEEIEPRIMLDESISSRMAEPLTQLAEGVGSSLSTVGIVQNGTLSGAGWCARGLRHAWDGIGGFPSAPLP